MPRSLPDGDPAAHPKAGGAAAWKLALPALGVVYGDIGTSPLYTLKDCFHSDHAVVPTASNVLGVLSLVFWALTFTVTIKYLVFILRADNEGEGGILALLALVPRPQGAAKKKASLLVLLVLFGAALLYGDGVITPAISVLSAVEGLEVATTAAKPAVIPITVVTLLGLFLAQRRGTARIGRVFGPIMLVWFTLLAVLGVRQLVAEPHVLLAIDPRQGIRFFLENRGRGFLVLGGVVLAITGAEALYADMGHFGRGPIRRSWFAAVFPALILNYFGQGAALLKNPALAENPFYAIVPTWALYPTVVLATIATVIASQALISGAFSLTQQAVQLGYFPRVSIVHTSEHAEGQIFVPEINGALLVACVGLVLAFRSSTALAAAYGIAVTGTMAITSITYYVVVRHAWKWPRWRALPLAASFLFVDLGFFASTATKFFDGGWFPILLASSVFVVMVTWQTGRRYLGEKMAASMFPLNLFLADIATTKPARVRGTAVFMSSNPEGVPPVLLHHFKHNQVLHEQVVLLTVSTRHVPQVHGEDRIAVEALSEGFFRVALRYGFAEKPDVPRSLAECAAYGLALVPDRTSYYLGRETLLPTGDAKMWTWRKKLFAFIARNSVPATAYFALPPGRVLELGMQITL